MASTYTKKTGCKRHLITFFRLRQHKCPRALRLAFLPLDCTVTTGTTIDVPFQVDTIKYTLTFICACTAIASGATVQEHSRTDPSEIFTEAMIRQIEVSMTYRLLDVPTPGSVKFAPRLQIARKRPLILWGVSSLFSEHYHHDLDSPASRKCVHVATPVLELGIYNHSPFPSHLGFQANRFDLLY